MSKYKSINGGAGFWGPQLKVQITPLYWSLGIGWGDWSLALSLGPIAVRVWFRTGAFNSNPFEYQKC